MPGVVTTDHIEPLHLKSALDDQTHVVVVDASMPRALVPVERGTMLVDHFVPSKCNAPPSGVTAHTSESLVALIAT